MSPQDNTDAGDDTQTDSNMTPRDWRQFRASLISRPIVVTDENRQINTNTSMQDNEIQPNASKSTEEPAQALSWAHPLVTPERGCVLIANMQGHTFSQTLFGYAVVTLVEYTKEGSMGFITNR